MGRSILAVVVGFVTLVAVVFISLSAAYLAMGAERAFRPESYEVSATWIGVSIVLSLIAAVAGGWVCALIARPRTKPPLVLAGVVLVLGLVMAAVVVAASSPGPRRDAGVSNFEAMRKAQQPVWLALLNPFIEAVGVVVGAKVIPTRRA